MKEKLLTVMPGFLLACLTGALNWYFAGYLKIMDSLVPGLAAGIMLKLIIGDQPRLTPGFNFAASLFIPLGIISYGTNLRFDKLLSVPIIAWLQLIVGIICIFAAAFWAGRRLKLSNETSILIAAGTSICGASAIIITTPVIKAREEDTSVSMITITVWGIIATVCCILLQMYFNLSATAYSLFCATTLPMTGMVKITSSFMGQDCTSLALAIKMARTAMIIPVLLMLTAIIPHRGTPAKNKAFFTGIPWFLYVFLLSGSLFSFVPWLTEKSQLIQPYAAFFFTIALASIGLTVNMSNILSSMRRALLVGLLSWLVVSGIFAIGNLLIGY